MAGFVAAGGDRGVDFRFGASVEVDAHAIARAHKRDVMPPAEAESRPAVERRGATVPGLEEKPAGPTVRGGSADNEVLPGGRLAGGAARPEDTVHRARVSG